MKNTYTITTADGKLYIKETTQKILDIVDRRDMRDRYKPSSDTRFVLTYDIHYTFAEQLTLQISPKFYEMVNYESLDAFYILFVDRYFLRGDDTFYFLLALHDKPEFSHRFWVKCFADIHSLDLSKENQLRFDICNHDESMKLHMIRFDQENKYASITHLQKELNEYLNRNTKRKEKKHLDSDGSIEYPDVIIRCHMKKRATKS